MFICGTEHAHVDNISYLVSHTGCSLDDIYKVINKMSPNTRTRYGANYSKTDFSELQKIYNDYIQGDK